MPEIKTRPGMNAPKARQADTAPKEAANILKRQYAEKQAERQPQPKNPVQYATDKVEKNERRAAALAADGTRRAVRQAKQRRERGKSATDTEPRKESAPAAREPEPHTGERPSQDAPRQRDHAPKQAERAPKQTERRQADQGRVPQGRQTAPKTRQNAVKGLAEAEGNQPAPSFPQELRRQKVVQNTVRTRQETRRGIDAEISRVESAVDTEQKLTMHTESAGELPSKLIYRAEYGADTPRTSACFADKLGKTEGKAARPRTSGVRVPSKPAFTLKDRAATGRQLQRNTVTAAQRAKQAATQKLRCQAAKKRAENAQKTTKKAAQMTIKATKVIVGAVKSAVSSIAAIGGAGAVLVVVLVVIALIAAIVASPFGIFFSNDSASADTVPISAAVAQVNFDFNARLEELQSADTYDDITVDGSTADWAEILAVFAAKVAGSDGPDATDVATIDADRIDRLKAVFWDMNAITSTVETIDHPGTDGGEGWVEKILHITLTPKAAADMPSVYGFTARQTDAMNELLDERAALAELVGNLTAVSADAAELMKRLPADLSLERREVVRTACSLVGKVNYFWGGKSLVLGWDSRWGTIQKVWAEGNSTSGTYRPYSLDCSGFVDWVFYNVSGGAYVIGHGGGATMQHTYCTPISWADAIPGDLVFYPDDMHIGIVGGRDADGNLLIIHCASSYNCVVITSASGFTSVGRPTYYAAH